jgi:thiamine-monophosphate kinase
VKHRSGLPEEFEIIGRYFAPLSFGFAGAFDLTDDVAVIAPGAGQELVVKTDAIVGGMHFMPDDSPDLVARKALRVNLSDLAAKGAIPRAYMLALILPDTIAEAWVAEFVRGLAEDQSAYGVHLIGGDTDMTPGPVMIAITAFGVVPTGQVLRRNGARAGDTIFVTGTIGDAALGVKALRGELPGLDPQAAEHLVDRYRLPRPRVSLGPRLLNLATATIDISDGLVADLRHVCEASRVDAVVQAPLVPLSAAASFADNLRPEHLKTVLTGGDDYEILFTAPIGAAGELARLSRAMNVPITAIGRIEQASAERSGQVSVIDAQGRPFKLEHEGWTHF